MDPFWRVVRCRPCRQVTLCNSADRQYLQELCHCRGISVLVVIVCHSLQEHLADGSQGDIVYKALLERAAAEPVRCCFNGCQLAQGEALQGTKLSLSPLAAVLPWWRSVLPSSSCSFPGKGRWLALRPTSFPAASLRVCRMHSSQHIRLFGGLQVPAQPHYPGWHRCFLCSGQGGHGQDVSA